MTLSDLLTLIAGVAIALKLPSPFSWPPTMQMPAIIAGAFMICGVALMAAAGVMLVTLRRQWAYKRVVHPAEWLAILMVATWISEVWPFRTDDVVNMHFGATWTSASYSGRRWLVGAAALAIVLNLAGITALARRFLASWIVTLLLAAAAVAWLWGPVVVFSQEVSFPAGPWTDTRSLTFWLYRSVWDFARSLLSWILFGVPAMAALIERRTGQRRWVWTEWTSVVTALVPVTVGLVFFYMLYSESPSEGLTAQRIVLPIWIGVVAALSWLIVWAWARIATPRH